MHRSVIKLLLCIVLGTCLLAAAPATNPAAGKFDNVALRTGAQSTGNSTSSKAASTTSALEGFDTRRVALSLAGVISLILVLKLVARKFLPHAGGASSSSAARVLSRTPIAPRQQVMLLQVGRRVVVVGDSGTQLTSLSEITDPDEVAALVGQIEQDKISPASKAFRGLFARAQAPFEEPSQPEQAVETLQSDELSGLAEKVRLLSSQFRRGAS